MDEIIDWVRASAIPITTVEPGNGFADMDRLRQVLVGTRIVALGEATHGTREFFQLKHRLLECCVAELGFTVFGIEASYPECLRVNDYVLHGIGNLSDPLTGMRFWTWDAEEVLELIQWIRNWNRMHEKQVKFYGFDMQFPTEAAQLTLHYIKRVAPELAISSEAALRPLCDDLSAGRFHLFPDAVCATAFASIERFRDSFVSERAMWVAATSELAWRLARLNVNVLNQSAQLRRATSRDATVSRDVAMAENVAAVLGVEGPQAKAVLWVHNRHVARQITRPTDDKDATPTMGLWPPPVSASPRPLS